MDKKIMVKQALKLYRLGLRAKKEQDVLEDYVERFGLSSPECVRQALKVEKLLDEFVRLERIYCATAERVRQEAAGMKPALYILPSNKRWNV